MEVAKICWSSQELRLIQNQIIVRIKPMSPIRLYRIACKAAVFASVRPNHQPINRNDIIPTPSQPINSWNRLLADTKMIIVIRNMRRYFINRSKLGSECIYHRENSIIDHVTNRATGMKRVEKKSNLKLMVSLIEFRVIQCQLEIISSLLRKISDNSGIKLIRNDSLIELVTYFGRSTGLIILVNDNNSGSIRVNRMKKFSECDILITFIWSCTNFLVPKTNGLLLSYGS